MSKYKRPIRVINSSRQKVAANVKIGEEFDAFVKDIVDTGSAVVEHPNGTVVFVPGLWLGERGRVRIVRLKKRFAEAELLELLEPCEARVAPACSIHGFNADQCGGCPWMFVDYAAQLQVKQNRAVKALQRLWPNATIEPILSSESSLHYRGRGQLKTDGQVLGFVANGLRELVDVDRCEVLTEGAQHILTNLRQQLPNSAWEAQAKKTWATLDFDEQADTRAVSLNQRLPFRQVNDGQNQVMRQWLADRLKTSPSNAKVVELFAGSGNLTEGIAAAGFNNIVAVEVVGEAIAAINDKNLPGVTAVAADLFDEQQFEPFWSQHTDAEILVLDPPREGLKIREGLTRKKSKLRDVFYISCDLATLCRDLEYFRDKGFKLMLAQPLDMFPQTPHLEMLVHLRRSR